MPTSIVDNTNAKEDYKEGADAYQLVVRSLDTEKFLDLMSMDKKVADGQLSLILLEGDSVGKSLITDKFRVDKLREVVHKYCTEGQ